MTAPRRLKVAFAGTGGIAEATHIPALAAQGDRVEIVAATDLDSERLAAFCEKNGIPRSYATLDELLAAEKPDLVHICTPPVAHAEQTEKCLKAGSWVLVEKPVCPSLAEFDRIAAAEKEGGPYASVVFQHRFGPEGAHLAELIKSGELGRPLVAVCNTVWFRPHAYFDVPWRGKWATEGGGPTMGHGIHQMDLMLALLGDWEEISAFAGQLDRNVETEDVSVAIVKFESGAVATIVNSILSPREESYLRFDFVDATVELSHLYGYSNDSWTFTPAPHVTDQARIAAWRTDAPNERSSHRLQLAAVLDAIEKGVRPPVSGADGRITLELITGLYESAFTGRTVKRSELTPGNPFYQAMHGNVPGWAPVPTSQKPESVSK